MNAYITGNTIRQLREANGLTQAMLAEKLHVSDKTVSKWETSRGLPDISMLEPLAAALKVSVTELLRGERIVNRNVSANLLRAKVYVCPICQNILTAGGEASVSCCGVNLPPLSVEIADEAHTPEYSVSEDEIFVSFSHEMTKQHYLSFLLGVRGEQLALRKFYPEGNAECRVPRKPLYQYYVYCNHHGLMKLPKLP